MPTERPQKKCDLVMKGGVTSGIVYPKAIAELSKEYTFCNIGGTSAGAIAASVAAAAEYARAGGDPDAFERVDELPGVLSSFGDGGRHSRLFHLFQPQARFKGLYGIAMASMGRSGMKRYLAIFFAALWAFPLLAIAGVLPPLVFLWLAVREQAPLLHWIGLVLAIFWVIFGIVLAVAVGTVRLAAAIPRSQWGICTGMTEKGMMKKGAAESALVPWLADYLDQVAGKSAGQPLTFGDLKSRDVALQMISTDLTNGRPYTLPFGEHTHFYFKPDELKKFFPNYVVEWMVAHPGERGSRDRRRTVASEGLSVMPDAENMPVVVAVRMSLSFPFLFCPVPFYGVDFGFGPKTPAERYIPEPCLFVDGGLTSNFPLTLFDHPLPRWPTFGINLRDKNDGRHFRDIYMACHNSGGLEEWWTRFDERRGLNGLMSYFGLLFDTSRNWRDNLQMSVPGYRDRVVHIGLDPSKEGGLNLDMDAQTIASLVKLGEKAGAAILERYAPPAITTTDGSPCEVGLENQKWIRFRSFMALLEESLLSMDKAAEASCAGEATYKDLLAAHDAPSYPMTKPQQRFMSEFFAKLRQLAQELEEAQREGHSFQTHAPKPEPELKVNPLF